MLGKIFNTFFPMREFLNYLFKKTLGDYILNDLDLNKIEIEISNKAFISLKNIDLNAADINKKHLENFPFLMLEGQIKKFDLSFSLDKISISIDKLNILLMPIFNKEKTKNLIAKKQIPVKINESIINSCNNSNNNSAQKENAAYTKENTNNEFSLVSSFLNSALSNLEINVTNISISTLSYEASNTFQDNPILTFFISEICFRKKNEEDFKLVNENKNFQNLKSYGFNNTNNNSNNNCINSNNKKSSKNFNNLNYECSISNNDFTKTDKNINAKNANNNNNNKNKSDSNNPEKNSKNTNNNPNANDALNTQNQFNQLTFLSNKILLIDKIILRIHQQNQNIENEFFEMTNENEEKTNFNFFCNNSSILVFDYKSTGYSVLVDFSEALDSKNKFNESSCNIMDVNIDLRKLEFCINPLQMQILINYFDVFKMISLLKEKTNLNINPNNYNNYYKEFSSINNKNNNADNVKNNFKALKPIRVLKTILSKFSINLFFEGVNLIVLETNYMKDIPKLWSFFQDNYNKKIENVHALESHYSYMEDNFFLANLAKLKINFTNDFILNNESFEFMLEKVYFKYIEFLGKKKIIPANNITHCKLTFSNSNNNFLGRSNLNESFSANNNNNLNNSKVLFNSQLQKSKNYFNNNNNNTSKINFNSNNNFNLNQANNNNNSIYASNVYYMDKSMNRSSCSIYESVKDYDEAYNSDNSTFKNSLNNTIYQSTLESKDALLERYNLIFESEYLHESQVILELTNNSIADNCCVSIKTYKNYYVLEKNNSNNNSKLQQESSLVDNENATEQAAAGTEKSFTINFADYSKQYIEIIFKKIKVDFNPLYLYKATKLALFTQLVLNEFLYLIDNKNNNNNNANEDSSSENANQNNLKKAKSFKSDKDISPCKNRKSSENSISFIDKSVFKEDMEENFEAKNFNEQQQECKGASAASIYFKGCYEKSKQVLINFEEINLKIQTLKKDFYDLKGNCITNTNANLNEEFKKYEQYASVFANSKFLSNYIIDYYKSNVNPFISEFEKCEFNKSLIGQKQEIKAETQMSFFKINKDFLEISFSNHRILLNFKNEKIDKIIENSNNIISSNVKLNNENQFSDCVSYLNSLNKILYDFDSIVINFGTYNILKLKRDMLCSRNSANNQTNNLNNNDSKNNNNNNNNNSNLNQRKIFEFENSYCEKSDAVKRNSVFNNNNNNKNSNDVEQMISKNNLHFRLSPIVIHQKKTNYLQDAHEEEINQAFLKEFSKADEKINAKIESLYNFHNLNLIKNCNLNNFQEPNYSENKENQESIGNKLIEKMELNVNLDEDVYLTLEPQIIKKIIPFFDSILFSLNMHKLLAKKQKEIYNFYKEVYFVSLNIDNFKDFGFYYRSGIENKEESEKEEFITQNINGEEADEKENLNSEVNNECDYFIKFSAISLFLKNVNLIILKNNSDDYIGLQYKNNQYTNYLLKVAIINPFANLITKGANNSNILISISDLKIGTLKNKNEYFDNPSFSPMSLYSFSELDNELEKDNKFLKEISYEENLLLHKGDTLYKNIYNNSIKNLNEKADLEKDLEKYFKTNKQTYILTLVIKLKEAIKTDSSTNKLKNKNTSSKYSFNENSDKEIKTKKHFNNPEISNFQMLIENNLIPQSDTCLDIIIISNDAILCPFTYSNFNFEEIKTIAKEFGVEEKNSYSANDLNKLKAEGLKLNNEHYLNDLLLQTTKTQQASFLIREYSNTEFKLDIRDSSSNMEINLQNNLENLIRNEDILNHERDVIYEEIKAKRDKSTKENKNEEKEELEITEKNKKLINLFSQSSLNIDFNIEINRFSLDAFIEKEEEAKNKKPKTTDANNKNRDSSRATESIYLIEDKKATEKNKRKNKIRALIHIEKITHFKEIDLFSKKNCNITKRNLTIKNINIYLLKNLNHAYAELNILKLNNGRFHEDSLFKYLGFVELLNLNFVNLSFTREIAFFDYFSAENSSELKKEKKEFFIPKVFNDIAVKLGDISLYACKDTLDACIEIADALKSKANKLKDLLSNEQIEAKKNSNCNSKEKAEIKESKMNSGKDVKFVFEQNANLKEDEISSKIRNSVEIKKEPVEGLGFDESKIEVSVEENFFEKNNLRNVVFLDDYCNSSAKVNLKDMDSEYEKLGYSVKNLASNDNNNSNKDSERNYSIYDNRMSFDLNLNSGSNKDRKEETIILFDLESLKVYIYKGFDFNFIEEKGFDKLNDVHKDLLAKNKNRKNSSANEKSLNNDEILMILSNSLFDNKNNKKEAKETFNFFYDNQNNSIKFDENFFLKNSLNEDKNINNQPNNQINNSISNKNNCCNNKAKINLTDFSNIIINNNENTNASIYSKVNSEFSPIYNNKSMQLNENQNILSFNLIERFFFCEDKAKNKTTNSIIKNQSNPNYLELERKLLRNKKNQRDYNNHICINLECLKTKFSFFLNNEKISMNIFINKFDIEDYVENSKYKKIISKYVLENFDNTEIYENSKNSKKINKYKYKEDRPLLDFDIDIVKINESFKFEPISKNSCEAATLTNTELNDANGRRSNLRKNSDYKIEENVVIAINKEDNVDNIDIFDLKNKNKKLENDLIHVDGYISPINILLDQATLVFIIEFFLAKQSDEYYGNEKDKSEFAASFKSSSVKGDGSQRRNLDYKKINNPLDVKLNVEKLKSVDNDKAISRERIKIKESMQQENIVSKPIRTEYNSTNSTYSATDSNFGVETFSFNEENIPEADLHKKKTFLKNAKISEFFILFSYNAHSISLSKLTNKEYLELLNFSNISELKIDFKRFDYKGFLPIEEFPKSLINFWINDLKKEKTKILSNVINSVGFIKPFTTMMSGFFNMIVLPYKNYVQDKSLTNGLFGEFKNFVLKFTSQSLFLGEKTFLVIKKMISGAENTNLNKNSYYKKFLYMINDEKKKYEEYYYK